MKIQNIHKNTIRHRKNNGWHQRTGQLEKPENDTKFVTVINSCDLKKVAVNTV